MVPVARKVQSCQGKEGPSAGLHVVNLANALVSEHSLFSVGIRQISGFCSTLLGPRNKQFVHQLEQLQVAAATVKQILQGTKKIETGAEFTSCLLAWSGGLPRMYDRGCHACMTGAISANYLTVQDFIGWHMSALPSSAALCISFHVLVPSIYHGCGLGTCSATIQHCPKGKPLLLMLAPSGDVLVGDTG